MAVWQDSRLGRTRDQATFSGYGYLFFFLGTVLAAVVAREAEVVLALTGTLLFAGLFHRKALNLLRRMRLWLFVVPALLLSPLLIGEPDSIRPAFCRLAS